MNELTVKNSSLAKPASTRTLPPLLGRAVTEADIDWSNRVVLVDTPMTPEAYRGLEGAIAEVEAAMRPATPEQRMACLVELLTVFPMPAIDEKAMATRWGVYHKALADLPPDILARACEDLMGKLTFFPKPVEIRNAAVEPLGTRIKVLTKLRALRDLKVQVRERSLPEPTEEARARIRRLAATAFREMPATRGGEGGAA